MQTNTTPVSGPSTPGAPRLFGATLTIQGKADKAVQPLVFRMELPDFTQGINPAMVAIIRCEQNFVAKQLQNLFAELIGGYPKVTFSEEPALSIEPGFFGATVNFAGDPSVGLFPYRFTLELPSNLFQQKGDREDLRGLLKGMYEEMDGENRATVSFSDEQDYQEPTDELVNQTEFPFLAEDMPLTEYEDR